MALQFLDPTTELVERRIAYAKRPTSLAGLRIGLVDNTKVNADRLLDAIAGILEREHGAKSHMIRRKLTSGSAPHSEIIQDLKAGSDVIVAGIGD